MSTEISSFILRVHYCTPKTPIIFAYIKLTYHSLKTYQLFIHNNFVKYVICTYATNFCWNYIKCFYTPQFVKYVICTYVTIFTENISVVFYPPQILLSMLFVHTLCTHTPVILLNVSTLRLFKYVICTPIVYIYATNFAQLSIFQHTIYLSLSINCINSTRHNFYLRYVNLYIRLQLF